MKRAWPKLTAFLAFLLLPPACQINEVECDAECRSTWLDGDAIDDISLSDTLRHRYRVSERTDSLPAEVKKKIPVIIAIHGYTASTFEWVEFRDFVKDNTPWKEDTTRRALVSLVLLGGLGRNIEDFRKSTWQDWGRPIREEFDSLVAQGYENISFACASTGCPLLLEHIHDGVFKDVQPKEVMMIDPIVLPSAKILSLIRMVGPILGNSPNDNDSAEKAHWYTNRPAETLDELYALTNQIKNRLERGMTLPRDTKAKVWKAKEDALADPVGALLLYKGLRQWNGGRIEVEMVDTRKHVFTRLRGREGNRTVDYNLQNGTFGEMLCRVAPTTCPTPAP